MTSGSGAQVVRIDPASQQYIVNWDTKTCTTGPCTLDATKFYRIRIRAGGRELGFADVDVVNNGSELRNVATGEYIGLVNGRTLPVKFRIESGIPASVSVTPVSVTLRVGETQQFVATVTDLHAQPLSSAVVLWTSSTSAMSVDAAGLAGAHHSGSATITASVEALHADASVVVIERVDHVTLLPSSTTLDRGQTTQLVAATLAADGSTLTGRAITFESDHPEVATVGADGLVTAVAPGTATVTAASEGKSTTAEVTVLTPGFTLKANSLTAGDWHTCGLNAAGEAYCWGLNDWGQVGAGFRSAGSTRPVKVIGGHVFETIGAGSSYTCGLKSNGEVWCWGIGNSGEMGNGTFSNSSVPVKVAAPVPFTTLAVGGGHSCALAADGAPYCWGWNDTDRLGTTGPSRSSPVLIDGGHHYAKISAGVGTTCGIEADGTTWCWGNSAAGQSGATAVKLANGTLKMATVSIGYDHACGLGLDGRTWCWGNNSSGQFGNGSQVSATLAAPTLGAPGLPLVSVRASMDVSCGLTSTGEAWCWGTSSFGQLGNGTTGQSLTPSRVSTSAVLTTMATGSRRHTCAIATSGNVFCWGYNFHGSLGDGTTTDRSTPVQVVTP